ncbi:MAG: cytochrome c biogenesis protein CcdA [Limnochordaceae bacterium]|nr:cytochrome c biogenesis protein CcdA [Limnochordaceae bacterium]
MTSGQTGLTGTTLGLAFTAGLVSLLSPCVLALVPAYLGYLGSSAVGRAGRWHLLVRSLLFVLGFSLLFVALGASATALGQTLRTHQVLVRQVAGVLVVLLGLHQIGLLRLGFLDVERRLVRQMPGTASKGSDPAAGGRRRFFEEAMAHLTGGPWGALFVGMAFAAGWSPCVGPVLASILLLAGTTQTVWAGMGLLAVYAAGMALPFLAMAAAMQGGSRKAVRFLGRHGAWVERASGALLVVIGVMLYTNFFFRLPGYLNYYQWLGL